MKVLQNTTEMLKTVAPKKIVIRLPFDNAESMTELRARREKETDFQDAEQAILCTVSFAASELKKYLLKILSGVDVAFAQQGKETDGFILDLSCGNAPKSDCGYVISPTEKGVELYGNGRVGALYAAYTFLRMQGIRWYYPEQNGEILPPKGETLNVPVERRTYLPAMDDGRGLDIFAPLKDSEKFLLWMARNRMNITADHDYTAALGDKLGMTFRVGGHMFEPFLDPDKPLSNGRTIWETHPEWYGLSPDGTRKKTDALRNQFCVSRSDLIDYLADILIEKLRGVWKHVDRVDIWGFDCGNGYSCHCEDCKKVGNDTDRTIYFLSELRKRLDKTEVQGVTLVGCAYEGTKTMDAPMKPIPENLFARDCIVCYPIHRCYAHNFDDTDCPTNSAYMRQIMPWLAGKHLPMVMGEYYNVSRYEDLPLLFSDRIKHEIPLYKEMGFSSITYMHPPIYNWGVRALNHMLLAELSWDSNVDTDNLEKEYFALLYGKYADEMQKIYALVESASQHIGSYRNWWFSVLDVLLLWDGGKPTTPLDLTGHFSDYEELVVRIKADLESRKNALQGVERIIRKVKYETTVDIGGERAVTPEQARKNMAGNPLLARLSELKRSFIWGVDELTLFWLLVEEYIDAERDVENDGRWEEIERVYDKLSGYFYPQRYISKEVESFCEDALTRSQMGVIVDKRRMYKIQNGRFVK